MRLRKHQAEADRAICKIIRENLSVRRMVMDVTPGGGKSIVPQIVYTRLHQAGMVDKICWIVPRESLKKQAAHDFLDSNPRQLLGHQYEIYEAANECNPSRGLNGYATTFQAVGIDAYGMHADEFETSRYLLVLDEVHHARFGGSWHKQLQPLVDRAAFVLMMSGTLQRGDQLPIAFMPYFELLEEAHVKH